MHPRDSIGYNTDVSELVLLDLARVFGGVEHSMDAVEMCSEIQLSGVAVQDSLVVAFEKAHVRMRHVVLVREES